MGKTTLTEAQKAQRASIMETINAGLPAGITATNKQPVQKEIRAISSPEVQILWSTWCKDSDGNRYLALLQSNLRVKLIKLESLSNYKLRTV